MGDAIKRPPFPRPSFTLGGPEGGAIANAVEKLLHHTGSAAGAQAAHDDEREQPTLPAAWRPGVQQLRLLVLPVPESLSLRTHTHSLTLRHIHTILHTSHWCSNFSKTAMLSETLCSHFLPQELPVRQGGMHSWPRHPINYSSSRVDHIAKQEMSYWSYFLFLIECTNYVCVFVHAPNSSRPWSCRVSVGASRWAIPILSLLTKTNPLNSPNWNIHSKYRWWFYHTRNESSKQCSPRRR